MKKSILAVSAGWTSAFEIPLTRTSVKRHATKEGLLGDPLDIDLSVFHNYMYTGPLFFGTPIQGSTDSQYIYSTKNSLTSVISSTLTPHQANSYDPASSTTSVNTNVTQDTTNYFYDASGTMYTDVACWVRTDSNTCTSDNFLFDVLDTITSEQSSEGTYGTYGTLGLGYSTNNTQSFVL